MLSKGQIDQDILADLPLSRIAVVFVSSLGPPQASGPPPSDLGQVPSRMLTTILIIRRAYSICERLQGF
jgi:hypothetical protein